MELRNFETVKEKGNRTVKQAGQVYDETAELGEEIKSTLQAGAESAKDTLSGAASHLTDRVRGIAEGVMEEISNSPTVESAQRTLEEVKDQSVEQVEQVVDYLKQRPMTSIAIAALAGVVLGFAIRR